MEFHEQVAEKFASLEATINNILGRLQASETEHARVHGEIERTKVAATAAGTGSGGGNEFRLIDPKSMVPEKFGAKDGPGWRDWSEGTRAYVEMLNVKLAAALKEVEGQEHPLSDEVIAAAGLPEQHTAQLGRYLRLRTQGNAKTVIKAAQSSYAHVLEQWRKLSWEYDPKGLGSELVELHDLTSPEKIRAKTTGGISAAIELWEDLERRHKERNGLELPEKIRISILFKLIPADLADEILKQTTKWSSYTVLKNHLLALQFLRTKGQAPMISNLEEGGTQPSVPSGEVEIVMTEDGELLRLEKREGKRVAVRVAARGSKGASRGPLECWRCGREGHRRDQCTANTHKDGGPPKPPAGDRPGGRQPRTRAANNLEENTSDNQSRLELSTVSVDVCSLEPVPLCPLEQRQEDEWEEWEMEVDPWEAGADPWGGNPTCLPCAPNSFIPTVESIFKTRPKCEHCDRAGVYDDLAKRLKQESYFQPQAPPRKQLVGPRKAGLHHPPMPVAMPKDRPDGSPQQIWLASCIPAPPFEPPIEALNALHLRWQVPDVCPAEPDYHDCDDGEEWSDIDSTRDEPTVAPSDVVELNALNAVDAQDGEYLKDSCDCPECRGCWPALDFNDDYDPETGELISSDACPVESDYFDCDDGEEWSDIDSTSDESTCVPPDVFELNAFELNTVNAQDGEYVEITVDSGAGEAVCSPSHFPGATLVDSPGSLAGQKYIGPSGEEIPNEGQLSTSMLLEGGREGKFTFQAAPVRKPLLAVSSVNDKGNIVIFDGDQSFIIPGKSPAIAKLRALVRDIPGKLQLHRKNGVYNMKAWKPKSGFTRRG